MSALFSGLTRSELMSRIRSHGHQATELALVRVFRAHGITGMRRHIQIRAGRNRGNGAQTSKSGRIDGFRASSRRLLHVRPDFVFPKLRLTVFVDGCFWHACPRHCRMPAGNRAFWRAKLARNQARDRLVTRTLRKASWQVLWIWEHALHRATSRRATKRKQKGRSTPHPGPLLERGGEGEDLAASSHDGANLIGGQTRNLSLFSRVALQGCSHTL